MNSAFTPLAPLERWISYTQAEIVSIRSDLVQHLQAEIMKLRSDLISYHKQFADYQKICQSQLDVLTQQVRQSNQTMTEIQSSIIDLQNTQTEFARNIEDVYRKLISLSSQLHGRSPPETQTVLPPNTGGFMQSCNWTYVCTFMPVSSIMICDPPVLHQTLCHASSQAPCSS